MTLSAIDEDEFTNPGTLVRDILASAGGDRITDVDWGSLEGIAVTAVDNTHGTWQYTVNNGRTWLAFGMPTATTARLLGSDAGTRIRFVPHADWHGTVDPGLTFRAWDHTQAFNGQTADASIGGGATAFSAEMETAAITVNSVAPIGGTRIEMTIVETPSATAGNGEVATLPASRAWVHEWMPFWVEIWVSTPDTETLGIAEAAVDLQYDTAYLTATEIQYGPAFTQDLTGTIDDALGRVTAIGGATALTDVGDDAYVLLAQVRFASTGSDQVPVDEVGRNIGPYDMQWALADGQTQLVGGGAAVPELAPPPATELWAVMYDIDDNNLVDFGDLSFFAPAFGRSVGDAGSEPPYAWWADFDKSGLVDFGDLSSLRPTSGRAGRRGRRSCSHPASQPAGPGRRAGATATRWQAARRWRRRLQRGTLSAL